MKPPNEVTAARLFAVYQASGLSICEFTKLSLLEVAKLNVAALGDVEDGIAHLMEHVKVLEGSTEKMKSVLGIITFH